MNEKFAKGFAAGCISGVSSVLLWEYYLLKKKQAMKTPIISFTDNLATNEETARAVMEQTLFPTLMAAMQAGWSPEVFQNNIKAQFDMTSTIMISLYQDAMEEDLTLDQFKEKISSEIDFIIIDAKNRE